MRTPKRIKRDIITLGISALVLVGALNPGMIYALDRTAIVNGVDSITDKKCVPPVAPERITLPKAKIVEVDHKLKRITVLPEGKPDNMENYLILNVGPETVIKHEKLKKAYAFTDLEEGMVIKAVHASFQTASIPPQTPAYEITVLGNHCKGSRN